MGDLPRRDRYKRVRKLGAGGEGQVWLVEDTHQPGSVVALKELPESSRGTENALRKEFATLSSLRHPNLVQVFAFDVSPENGLPRFTLEFIDGVNIVEHARHHSASVLLELIAEALRALTFLHDFGLIHRDLKPQNLLVRAQPRDGTRLVVLDFGLSLRGAVSREGDEPAGTLPYMAPELFSGSRADRRSDLYAVGALVFEAVYGTFPVAANPANPVDFIEATRVGRRPDRKLPEGYPPDFAGWIDELIAIDPSQRPAGASEALARLNAACKTEYPLEIAGTRRARLNSGRPPGREDELAALRGLLETDSPTRLIWLTGDAGCGKTRVLRWLMAEAVQDGWEPVTDLFHSQLLNRELVIEEAIQRLSRLTVARPALVLFDEVELAGRTLVQFLERVTEGVQLPKTKVVAALRHAEARSCAISQMVSASGLLPGTARVDLARMGIDSVKSVCERVTGGRSRSIDHARWLLQVTDGNPLAIESFLVSDVWAQGGRAPRHQILEKSVLSRVDVLTDTATKWLEALAVLGRDSSELMVNELAGLDPGEARLAIAECQRLDLATVQNDRWKPASQLIAACVLEHFSEERSVSLHRRAAELVRATNADLVEAVRLARLYRAAKDSNSSVSWAIQAAEEASASGEHAEAAAWYRFALVQLGRSDRRRPDLRLRQADEIVESDRPMAAGRAYLAAARLAQTKAERATILARAARAMAFARRFKTANRLASRAVKMATSAGAKHAVSLAESAVGFALFLSGHRERAIRILVRAADGLALASDIAGQAEALHVAAVAESALRRHASSRERFQKALVLARACGNRGLEANILVGLGMVSRRQWFLEQALAYYRRARGLVERHGLKQQQLSVMSNEAVLLGGMGRYDACIALTRETEPIALRLGRWNSILSATLVRADSLLHAGRPAEAAAQVTEVLEGSHEGFEPSSVDFAKITLAESLLEGPDPADPRIRELLEAIVNRRDPDPKVFHGALVVEMERRAALHCSEPLEPIWLKYRACLDQDPAAIEPPVQIRALLAHTRALLIADDPTVASREATDAATLAEEKDIPHLGARAYGLLAEAQDAQGQRDAAIASINRGQAMLEEAADRIDDADLRRDFLDRAVFRDLRRSRFTADAATEDRLMAIYGMIRALNSESDPDVLLESMLDMALRVVQAERGMVLLGDESGDGYSVHLARNLEHETIRDAAEFSRTVVLRAGSGKAVLAMNAEGDDRLRDLKSVSMFGICSILCVPLRCRGKIIGAVYLDSRTQGVVFGNDDLRFLEAFADHAALALENARSHRSLEQKNRRLQVVAEAREGLGGLRGRSTAMQRVYDLIAKFADSNLPALIQGESGTGKELVARAIHAHGPRKRALFLSENCASIAETLLESELFGHIRGAFTGADRDRTGLFEQADGGTLFLDEVGDMSTAMQARLLRVLQEGEVRRVGADRPITVDVRLLAATNRILQQEMEAGRFREDLFYRLQVLVIQLPPLRERPGDVPLLVEHFLERISAQRQRAVPELRGEVLDLLERCAWPGNVRQLENVLQRLILLAGTGPVTVEVLRSDNGLRDTLMRGASSGEPVYSLERNERDRIQEALDAAAGNRAKAARNLGISRATIFRKIKEHGLN